MRNVSSTKVLKRRRNVCVVVLTYIEIKEQFEAIEHFQKILTKVEKDLKVEQDKVRKLSKERDDALKEITEVRSRYRTFIGVDHDADI
jgi:peptidoglycan hydrolase CwlO-like protein